MAIEVREYPETQNSLWSDNTDLSFKDLLCCMRNPFLFLHALSKQQFASRIIPHFPLAYLPIPFYNTDESIGSGRSAGAYVPVSPVSGLTLNIPGTHGGRCFSWKCIDKPKEEVLQHELQTSSSYYFRASIIYNSSSLFSLDTVWVFSYKNEFRHRAVKSFNMSK